MNWLSNKDVFSGDIIFTPEPQSPSPFTYDMNKCLHREQRSCSEVSQLTLGEHDKEEGMVHFVLGQGLPT